MCDTSGAHLSGFKVLGKKKEKKRIIAKVIHQITGLILLEACGYILVSNNFLSLHPAPFYRLFDIIQPTTGTNSTAALRQAKWIKNIFCVHPFGSKGASSSLNQLIRYTHRLHFNPMLAPQVSLQCVFPGDTWGGGGHASRLRCRRPADGAQQPPTPPPEISIRPHGDATLTYEGADWQRTVRDAQRGTTSCQTHPAQLFTAAREGDERETRRLLIGRKIRTSNK